MNQTYEWTFPLPRTHTGMLLGNGTLGAMIWGGGNVLNITLGRADFWDHRGGLPWSEQMNFATIRRLLEAGDEKGLRALFESRSPAPGDPIRPTVLPIGRLELVFPPEMTLATGELLVRVGECMIHLKSGGRQYTLRLSMAPREPRMLVELPEGVRPQVRRFTSWNHVGEQLKKVSFAEPEMIDRPGLTGWLQRRPADEPLCVGYREEDRDLWIAAELGQEADAAIRNTARLLDPHRQPKAEYFAEKEAWWESYWAGVPKLDIPHGNLSFLYYYGMYKFAGLTAPHGVPASLQGPWIEEYQFPPWSSDYHFNINVQMCYWPAYRGNRLAHLRPILDLVWSWRDKLRDNARKFVGIDDGYMLPHAVDDRGTNMGGFWSGTIDHACTAWVAKMMYDYWLFGGEEQFLREVAYPFMVGAMRVYEEMLEEENCGLRIADCGLKTPNPQSEIRNPQSPLRLPVSVSPEYRGNALNAWGANASFQLAAIHWLLEALQSASKVLNIKPSRKWLDIQERLPRACLIEGKNGPHIALWEGTPLEESHRHHSHLAGITPFNVIDIDSPEWQPIVRTSIRHWIRQGMGMWTGWCMPWAATIHAFVGEPQAAELILEIWQKVFTNVGHGTLHDCEFTGFTLIGDGPHRMGGRQAEIMQMDAGMGASAAILELLLHTRRGTNHLFAGAPPAWKNVAFENIRTEGGFLVSAKRTDGKVHDIKVSAERDGAFRLSSPWTGKTLDLAMKAGETRTIAPGS